MGNTLTDLMQTEILPLALAQLRENCVMPALVLTDFKGDVLEYKSTIRIPKPQNMGVADDVATDLNAHGETQDTNLDDDKVDIILDKWKYKQFSMTDKEIDESVSKGILPSAADGAIKTLANQVDSDLLALYEDIPYAYGQAGVTPSKTDDLTGVSKVLNKNLVDIGSRRLVIDPEAQAKLLNQFSDASKVGSTAALRQANLGQLFGFDTFMDQLVPVHVAGTFSAVAGAAVNGAVADGATTLNLDGGSGAETLQTGDLFTVDGVTGQFVFTADKTATSGVITGATFYPAAPAGGFPDHALVTVVASHTPNLAFHRNAFALAMRGLQADKFGSESSTIAIQTDPVSGLSLRLETWRKSGALARKWRFDILYGVKTLRAELAARLLG